MGRRRTAIGRENLPAELPDCLIGVEAADIFEPSGLALIKRHVDEIIEEGLGNFVVFRAYRVTEDAGEETVLRTDGDGQAMLDQLRRQKAIPVKPDSAAVEALRYACDRGLYCAALYTLFEPGAAKQIKTLCKGRFLFPMLGEMHGGMGEEMGQPAEDYEAPDVKSLDRQAVAKLRAGIARHREAGFSRVGHVDGPLHHGIGYRAGLWVSMTELMCGFVQLHLAATRGAADAFGKEFGSWIAIGYFGGANCDPIKPVRLRASLNASYLSGAKYILLESGQWGLHEFGNDVPAGNMLSRELRHEVKRFYAFAKRHPRPAPRPEVRLAFVKGRYDGWSGTLDAMQWRQAHGSPEYLTSSSERGWDYLDVVWPGKGRCDDYPLQDFKTPWLTGAPYGPTDIVPADTPLERLRQYRSLLFLGWNTMDAAQYRKLTEYAEDGGSLFMAVPHLATWTRRPPAICNPPDMPLFRNGRVESLFGARVTGCGGYRQRINRVDVLGTDRIGLPPTQFIMETALYPALVELKGARVAARTHDKLPFLTENRLGKGTAYLMCSWDFPGLNAYQAFMRFLVRGFAARDIGDVTVESDGPVDWAVYPGPVYDTAFALNCGLEDTVRATVWGPRGMAVDVPLGPGQMRAAYVFPDMILCLDSPMTALVSAERKRGWRLRVEGDEPVGLTLVVPDERAPARVGLNGDDVTEFGFTYPCYTFHFNDTGGELVITTRKAT